MHFVVVLRGFHVSDMKCRLVETFEDCVKVNLRVEGSMRG